MKTETANATAIQSPQLQAVLQHQEQQAQAIATVGQLQQLIAQRQQDRAALQQRAQRVDELETQREDLLADIATGQDKQAQLQSLDAELAALKSDIKNQGNQAAAEQTINGLQRKLAKAQDECDQLEKKRPDLARALLLASAEELGAEYGQAAARIDYLCRRLLALDSLLRDHGLGYSLSGRGVLQIPRFELNTMPASRALHRPNYLFNNTGETLAATFAVVDREKTALRAMGVQIG